MEFSRPTPIDAKAQAVESRSSATVNRALLEQGRRAFERGDDEAALRQLGRLVDSGLRFADVHYLLGVVHERRDELDAATTSLREAIRINPGYVEALLALASVCERRGDFEAAQGHAERAGQLCRTSAGGLDPTTRGKLTNQQAALADALAQAGLRREAIEQYRQALDRCPTFLDIRHRLGVSLREVGLPFQAMQEFERILDVHPGLVECRIQLGLTWYAMGRTADAVREWQSVLEADPTRREAHMYLRLVADPAERTLSTTASTAPASPEAPVSQVAPTSGWSTVPLATTTEETDLARLHSPNGVHPE